MKYKNLELPNKIFYAPLAGCSDYPFRQMSARYKPGLMYCEMVKMEPLVRGMKPTLRMLDYTEEMRPIGGQICGSQVELAGPAAKTIEDLGFDTVDLNCGCPVDKVTKDGSGSGMLKTPELIGEILAEMVAAVSIPVTVKIRAGWDSSSINAEEVTRIAEQAGAAAITVHGRTRAQAYKGPANWDYIKACKEAASSILVVGNGDVFSPEAAAEMFAYTGCDAVLVSRGTMGQPWMVADTLDHLAGKQTREKTFQERKAALLQHLAYSRAYKTEEGALIDMRKVTCWYWKNVPGARAFRGKASHATSFDEVLDMIEAFEES